MRARKIDQDALEPSGFLRGEDGEPTMRRHSEEPGDASAFTRGFDRFYTRFAVAYDLLVKALPLWKTWLRQALPHLAGPKVLEVSFGTG